MTELELPRIHRAMAAQRGERSMHRPGLIGIREDALRRHTSLASAASILVLLCALFGPNPLAPTTALAASITVNTLEDSFVANGNCSLREAISSANLNVAFDACTAGAVGSDTITIALNGEITLAIVGKNENNNAIGDFDILEPLIIVGRGATPSGTPANGTTINGNAVDRVFEVFSGASLELRTLTVFGGDPSSGGLNGAGGNIFYNGDQGALTLTRVQITNGRAGNGGGIFLAGGRSLVATDSLFFANRADGQPLPNGGGSGGGLFADINSVVDLVRVSFVSNVSTNTSGQVAPRGGAIYLDGDLITATNLYFQGNSATGTAAQPARGGAVYNDGTAFLINVTFFGDAAAGTGGSGGAVWDQTGSFTVQNTLIASGVPNNCGQTIGSAGHNLDSGASCGLAGAGDINNGAANLGPDIFNENAPVQGRAPLAGSQAIDAADPAACPANDILARTRPRDGDGNGTSICDIGAVETIASASSSASNGGADGQVSPGADKPNDDDIVRSRKQTEDQRRHKERTNRAGRDDYACEGNVVEVHPEAAIPYVIIANRDGLVTVLLLHDAALAKDTIRVGDYLEADGVKEHEHLFEADSVRVVRR